MASKERAGLAALPANLLRPTTPPKPPADDLAPDNDSADQADDGDQGEESTPKTTRRRARRPVAMDKAKGRKISLPDDVHDRLQLQAFQKRTTISAVAAEILDRNLPRFRVEREG